MSKVTTRHIARMRELAADGVAAPEIADALGIGATTVRHWAKYYGIALPRRAQPVSVCTMKKVAAMAGRGLTRHDIACLLGIKASRVRWIAESCNIPLEPARPGRPATARRAT